MKGLFQAFQKILKVMVKTVDPIVFITQDANPFAPLNSNFHIAYYFLKNQVRTESLRITGVKFIADRGLQLFQGLSVFYELFFISVFHFIN